MFFDPGLGARLRAVIDSDAVSGGFEVPRHRISHYA